MRWGSLVGWCMLVGCGSESAPPGEAAPTASTTSVASASARPEATATGSAEPLESVTADPGRLKIEGKAVQGGLLRAKLDDPKTRKITFPGHRVVISPEGEFWIAFFRNAPPKGEKITVVFPDGQILERAFAVEGRAFEEEKIDGLPESFVKMDPETKVRHAKVHARIDKVRMGYDKTLHCEGDWAWPTKGKITSRYGYERILNGTDGGIHWGVDIAAAVGAPVRAPCGGKVVAIEKDVPLAGNTLVLDHGQGLTSTFIHLSAFKAEVGDIVETGDVIAAVGNTGRSTGPHLDWRMNLFEVRVDPELLVPPMP